MNIFKTGRFPNYQYRAFSDKDAAIMRMLWRICTTSKIKKNKIKAVNKLNESKYLDGIIVWV